MDQFTRRLIGFGVHAGDVDGIALCRMFNKAISGMGTPKYFSTDHDPLFEYHRWQANLHFPDVVEIKTIPPPPVSHPFVERLIGTLYAASFQATYSFGMPVTWIESLKNSGTSITVIVYIGRSVTIRQWNSAG